MDILHVEQLWVITTIGIYDWEQSIKQRLLIDIKIGSNITTAAKRDDISNCINYNDVSKVVVNYTEKRHFALIERVAEEVAQLLLRQFNSPWVRIKVSKPGALPRAANVSIAVERIKN